MSGTKMQLEDWLDDLCVRFIINLPQEDLSSVARICFQVEEAQWFYEDFIRPLDPTLPSMTLRTFCLRIFQHCPLLASFSVENHTKAFEQFLEYKTRVPVRGAIMLNEAMDSTVLVKGWKKGANWSFPRGKINKDEDDLDCAIREVYEETGLDLRAAGLVPTEAKPKYIEISMREQHMRLYVFRDVPMDTKFEPKTRKEISKIQWYKLSELPAFRKKNGQNQEAESVPNANKFYMVAPFLVPLKRWVIQQMRRTDAKRAASGAQAHLHPHTAIDEVVTEDDMWTQTDTGMETASRTPAIETLEGATQELQRLLKVQPPTQGLQPTPTKVDKGSALLSILQAKAPSSNAAPPILGPQLPQTPLELTVGDAPQPHTPHHHNHHHVPTVNTQQPPPSFPLSPNQQAVAFNQGQMQPAQMQAAQMFHQQQYGNNQAALAHPQPLPPQVQRSVFNRSAFQENQYAAFQGQLPQQMPLPQQGPGYPAGMQMPPPGAMPMGNMGPGPLPGPMPGPMPGQPPLSNQSMALLNAFKGGRGVPNATQENVRQPQAPVPSQNYPPYNPTGLPPGQPQQQASNPPMNVNRPPMSPQELAGSKVGPPADNHRSALLGMFRKEAQSTVGQSQSPGSAFASAASPASSIQAPSATIVDANAILGLDMLSIKPSGHTASASVSTAQPGYNAQQVPQPSSVSGPTSQQPIRILQRGQADVAATMGGPSSVSSGISPSSFAGQPAPGQMANPPNAASFPVPGIANRGQETGGDQKRQLLSLFGKSQAAAAGLEAGKGKEVVVDAPRSRMASLASGAGDLIPNPGADSRRGSQTPISPAERSFLLGYLESVTNSATR